MADHDKPLTLLNPLELETELQWLNIEIPRLTERLLHAVKLIATWNLRVAPVAHSSELLENLEINPKLQTLVTNLPLSSRSLRYLADEKIFTVGELISYSERRVLKIPGIGVKSFNEIKKAVTALGLSFSNVDPWQKRK